MPSNTLSTSELLSPPEAPILEVEMTDPSDGTDLLTSG